MTAAYAHPETLVSTGWVAEHARDPGLRIVEVDVDPNLYEQGHLPGAVGWDWEKDLCDPVRRDILGRAAFEQLCSRAGIANDTRVLLYGDANNWFAAWAFWQFAMHGHADVCLMNGGRKKWELEGRPYTDEKPRIAPTRYRAGEADTSIRAFQPEVAEIARARHVNLVDVRSPDEFTGKVIAPPGMNETAQRGGHIPGATNVPWGMAVNEDGTFRSPGQLRALYEEAGVWPDRATIAYCRIGERSSHTWYVLKYLLGYKNVKNYDGSWTEWGNLIGAPIEK